MPTWATADDVVAITGREASAENLVLAQTIVELYAGTEAELTDGTVSARNGGYLTKAVAFQAVWLDSHPDALDAMDVTGVSADGVSAQHATDTAAFLAPLARRCINRLTWKSGPLRVGPRKGRVSDDTGNRDSAVRDDQFEWTPFGQVWGG